MSVELSAKNLRSFRGLATLSLEPEPLKTGKSNLAKALAYDIIKKVEEIAKIGLEAAIQFDRKTGLPLYTHCIDLN